MGRGFRDLGMFAQGFTTVTSPAEAVRAAIVQEHRSKTDRQGTCVAAHVFPPLGGHWRDFAFWADGLGELHQNPFATGIRSHSGHHWRVFGLGRAPMDRLCLVR